MKSERIGEEIATFKNERIKQTENTSPLTLCECREDFPNPRWEHRRPHGPWDMIAGVACEPEMTGGGDERLLAGTTAYSLAQSDAITPLKAASEYATIAIELYGSRNRHANPSEEYEYPFR